LHSVSYETGWVAIVDDDECIRRCLRRILLINGINVRTFCSAEKYLDRVDGDMPRCIVLDVQMSGMTGFELQAELRRRGRLPPIVFITALADLSAADLAARSEGCGFLRKPFSMQSFLDHVAAACALT
jgi:FixJ family two-component response regulator